MEGVCVYKKLPLMFCSGFPLRRRLGRVLVLKLIALWILWFCCVRDVRVSVSPADMARQLTPNPSAQGVSHGQ
jgi:hypothetical protein